VRFKSEKGNQPKKIKRRKKKREQRLIKAIDAKLREDGAKHVCNKRLDTPGK